MPSTVNDGLTDSAGSLHRDEFGVVEEDGRFSQIRS